MLQHVPEVLSKPLVLGESIQVPTVMESIMKFRATAIATALDAINGKTPVGASGIEEQKQVFDFWTNDLPKAWKLRESGTYL